MVKTNWYLFTGILVFLIACSYINGKGDADDSAKAWVRDNLPGATFSHHECQDRDTDDNGYVSCTVSVSWEEDKTEIEIIPIECSVNRAGNGCGNKGCRPLATFRTRGEKVVSKEKPYKITKEVREVRSYNPDYGDERICVCDHPYYRHFDTYEGMLDVGCKYCDCRTFKE